MLTETQKQVLQTLVLILNNNNIPFHVSGGLAAIFYGSERDLYDIDIDIYKKDIPKIRKLFKGYIIKDYHNLIDEQFDIWLLTLMIDGILVDISQAEEAYIFKKDGTKIKMDSNISKARNIEYEELKIPVQDKKELIAYKRMVGRETDLMDIRSIRQSS